MFPAFVICFSAFTIQRFHLCGMFTLNGLFKHTLSGCNTEVQPPSITAWYVLFSFSVSFTFPSKCALNISHTSSEFFFQKCSWTLKPNIIQPLAKRCFIDPTLFLDVDGNVRWQFLLWHSFTFKHNSGFQFCSVCQTRKNCSKMGFVAPCSFNNDCILALDVDCSVSDHVKEHWSFIHISDVSKAEVVFLSKVDHILQTRGPRWPWIAHLIFWDCSSQFFFCRFQRRIYKNFFMSVLCKKPSFTNTMFIDRSKFQEQFWKGSLKEHFYEIISKSDQ